MRESRTRSPLRLYSIGVTVLGAVSFSACESTVVAMVDVEVEIVPTAMTLVEGSSAAASAVVRERGGEELQDVTVTWTVEDARIATVDSRGVVAGHARGTTRLRASSGGVVALASVTVIRQGRGGGGGDDDDCDVVILGVCVDD